jgi:hypothetical protein
MKSLFNADILLNVFKLGPPGLLILCLVVILYRAVQTSPARNGSVLKGLSARDAIIYSSITAIFFVLWIISIPLLPMLDKRQIDISITVSPEQLSENYGLRPIKYKFGTRNVAVLSREIFDMPEDHLISVDFYIDELTASYRNNEEVIYIVAIEDPACLAEQSRGVSAIQLPPLLRSNCPGAFIKWSHEHKASIEIPQ